MQTVAEGLDADGEERLWRVEVAEQVPETGVVPEFSQASRQTGEGGFEVFADLTTQDRGFHDQVAAMAHQQSQRRPVLLQRCFDEREAVDRRAVEGCQVGVVGLVAGVGRLAELLGGKGMDDGRLKAGGRKGVADQAVIVAGAFDRHQQVAQLLCRAGLTELGDRPFERGSLVLDFGRR